MYNDVENGTTKLKTRISMELIKKINEKIPQMEIKIKKNLNAINNQLKKFHDLTNEDYQAKLKGILSKINRGRGTCQNHITKCQRRRKCT